MAGDLLVPPDGIDVVSTNAGRLWFVEDIVFEVIDVDSVERRHVEALAEAVRGFVGEGRTARLIADIHRVRWASADARTFSSSEQITELVAAQAMVVSSPVSRMVGSFFLRVSDPPYPTRLFTVAEDAVSWLHSLETVAC